MRGISKIVTLCGVLLALTTSFAPAVAQQRPLSERLGFTEPKPEGRPYFVEFRAAHASITGHTWIIHGRVDPSGRVLSTQYADLYPVEPELGSYVGAIAPVRGHVRTGAGEGQQRPVATYRRYVTAAEYARVQAVIAREQRVQHLWSLWLLNCNDFAIKIADAIGLRTPPGVMLPQTWVTTVRLLNGR
ncbi:MAG: hypothetical protein JO245_05985 [Pseudolabrys sp.]|nr:hypothetical protein [Pseudolabrys sp.]